MHIFLSTLMYFPDCSRAFHSGLNSFRRTCKSISQTVIQIENVQQLHGTLKALIMIVYWFLWQDIEYLHLLTIPFLWKVTIKNGSSLL